MLRRSSRPGPGRAAGTTLLELAFAMGVLSVLGILALALGMTTVRGVEIVSDSARAERNINHLRDAVVSFYRESYCRHTRRDDATPLAAPVFPLASASVVLADHALTGTRLPKLGDSEPNEFDWEIVRPDDQPARLRIFWRYPGYVDGVAAVARKLDGYCDDDGDADTAEPCDAEPGGERIVVVRSLSDVTVDDPTRKRRVDAWVDSFGVACDNDGNDVLDDFCDCGAFGCARDGDFGPVDINGDGMDDDEAFDADDDGVLDFDLNGDLNVDAEDWRALGC